MKFITLIILTIALLNCQPVKCQEPDPSSIRFFNVRQNQLFDANRVILNNYTGSSCLGQADTTLGPDGWIYGFVASYNRFLKFDPVTGACIQLDYLISGTTVLSPRFSPSGRYLYYVFDTVVGNSAFRIDLQSVAKSPEVIFTDPNYQIYSIDFSNIGVGFMFLSMQALNASRGGVRFGYAQGTDVITSNEGFVSWSSQPGADVQRCRGCPIGFASGTCCMGWQIVYAMSIFNNYGQAMMDSYGTTVVGTYFFDLVSVPWGGVYASTDYFRLYRYTVSSFPTFSQSSEWINNGTLAFHAFLAPPNVLSPWLPATNTQNLWCYKFVSFPKYNWTRTVVFETADGPESNFLEYSRSESNDLDSVTMEIDCSNKTGIHRARVRYIGDSDTNIYTLPSLIRCSDAPPSCQVINGSFNTPSPPPVLTIPNIIPILECISAVTANNFTAYFGYNNTIESSTFVPTGALNMFSGIANRGQTVNFLTGRTPYWPTTAFTAQFPAGTFSWRLTYFNLTFTTTDPALACPTNVTLRVLLRTSSVITQQELGLIGTNIANQLGLDLSQVVVILIGGKKRQSDISELEVEISTVSPNQNTPPADPSQIVQNFVQLANNETLAQQTFNPLNDSSRSVVSVDTVKTGVEQQGSLIGGDNNGPITETSPTVSNDEPKSSTVPVVSEAYSIRTNFGSPHLILMALLFMVMTFGDFRKI